MKLAMDVLTKEMERIKTEHKLVNQRVAANNTAIVGLSILLDEKLGKNGMFKCIQPYIALKSKTRV